MGSCAGRHGTASWAWALRRCREVSNFDKFDVKDQIGLGRDSRMGGVGAGTAFGSISELPGNEQATLAADLHTVKTLVEAGDEASHALRKCHGLRVAKLGLAVCAQYWLAVLVLFRLTGMVIGGVELVAVVGAAVVAEVAGVLHLVHLVGLGVCARA